MRVKLLTPAAFMAILLGLFASAAWAQEGYGSGMKQTSTPPSQQDKMDKTTKEGEAGINKSLRKEILNPVNEAVALDNKKDYLGALAKAKEADAAASDKTPFEEYVVAKLLGHNAVLLHDNVTAAAAFNRVLASNAAPKEEIPALLKIAMGCNINVKNYPLALSQAKQLQQLGTADANTSAEIAFAYYLNDDFPNTLKTAKAAVDGILAGGGKPTEQTLQILLNAQIKTGDQTGARQTLEQLALSYNDSQAWGQLINLSMHQGQSSHQLLLIYRLRMLAGAMKGDDYVFAANIAKEERFFREARNFAEKGLAAGVSSAKLQGSLSASRTGAKDEEIALGPLAHAADASKSGELDVTLGETYWTYGRYAEAQEALEHGIAKGGLKDSADAHLSLGIALLSEGKKDEAIQEFDKASASKSLAPVAHIWTLYAKRATPS